MITIQVYEEISSIVKTALASQDLDTTIKDLWTEEEEEHGTKTTNGH